jgi:hypothetical protein
MAPFRTSTVQCGAGALLALASWFVSPASGSPEVEGATSAAPSSCAAEQFVLRSYVIALQTGDVTSGARDAARIASAITPLCRQAIESGRWPGLANELLAHVSDDPALKRVICAIAPPEAGPAIAQWETGDTTAPAAYDLPCAVALFRHRPGDFERVVVPRLGGGGGCAFPDLATRLGEAVGPDERIKLLPTLDFATRTRAQGRDRLYDVLCQHPAARSQALCQAPAVLEPTWAHEARIRRATPRIALHVGLAALFALAISVLRQVRGKNWPALGMSVAASAVTAAALAWIIAGAPTPGAAPPDAPSHVVATVVTLLAALVGGGLAWALIRAARGVALAWCLVHAVVYAVVTALHAWASALDRLC